MAPLLIRSSIRLVLVACALPGCGVEISRLYAPATADGGHGPLADADAGGDAGAPPDGLAEAGVIGGAGAEAPRGVQIGAQFVPREKAIVLLHIGHSNMAGRAAQPEALKPLFYEPHPQLWSFRPLDPIGAMGPIDFRPAQEPLAQDTATMGRAGPGMALLRSALAHAPDAHVISIGSGQSGASYGLCESYKRGGLFYEYTMTPARALRGQVTFAGLFTMFGANEYWGADPTASGLSACLRQLAADVRADLGEPELPILLGDFEMSAWGPYLPTLPGPAAVIAQLRLAVAEIPRSALIPTENLPLEDDHHFNLEGHRLWAERALTVLVGKGWAPWAGAPAPMGAP